MFFYQSNLRPTKFQWKNVSSRTTFMKTDAQIFVTKVLGRLSFYSSYNMFLLPLSRCYNFHYNACLMRPSTTKSVKISYMQLLRRIIIPDEFSL